MIRTPSDRHRADELFMCPPRSIATIIAFASSTVIGPQVSEIVQVTPQHPRLQRINKDSATKRAMTTAQVCVRNSDEFTPKTSRRVRPWNVTVSQNSSLIARGMNPMSPDVLAQRAQQSNISDADRLSSSVARHWIERRRKSRASFSQWSSESPWLALNRSIAREEWR
jgi:hypothetical protein